MKTAVIGVGSWGRNIARELNTLAILTGYVTTSNSENPWIKENLPSVKKMTLEDVCDDTSIKAVAIATPIHTQTALVKKLLESGKHVFVEKPFGSSADVAYELAYLAQTKGVMLMVGYIFLYHPRYIELKETVRTMQLRKAQCYWTKYGSFKEDIKLNLLTHHIAFAIDLFGKPVSAHLLNTEKYIQNPNHVETEIICETGILQSTIDRNSNNQKHTCVLFDNEGGEHTWSDELLKSDKSPLSIELKTFTQAVTDGTKIPTDGFFAAQVLQVYEELQNATIDQPPAVQQ